MASVRVDLSDPTARRICMNCTSNWTRDMERCPDCGSALLSGETIAREFQGSVPHAREPVPEPTSLELLCTTTGEDEKVRLVGRLEERELPLRPATSTSTDRISTGLAKRWPTSSVEATACCSPD
jgi:hypothetical protein